MNKISTFTFVKNAIKYDYPFMESIRSVFDFSDELIIIDGYSNDGTYEKLKEIAEKSKKINLKRIKTIDIKGSKLKLNFILKETLKMCKNQWCFFIHPDEVFSEQGCEYLKNTMDLANLNSVKFDFLNIFENANQILVPLKYENEFEYFQTAVRLFKKTQNTDFINNGWSINIDTDFVSSIPIHHYHFMKQYQLLNKEIQEQPDLLHQLPIRYKAFIMNEKYKRGILDEIKPYLSPHPKFMKKISKAYSCNITKPQNLSPILFIMDTNYHANKVINFLPDIYNTGLLQKKFEIHELEYDLLKLTAHKRGKLYNNGVNSYYLTWPEIQNNCTKDLLEYIKPEVTVIIGALPFFASFIPMLDKWEGNVLGWFELNSNNIADSWTKILLRCQKNLTLSEFAHNKIPMQNALLLPGADGSLFYPRDTKTKKELRQKWKIPHDATVFLCNDLARDPLLILIEAYDKMCNSSKQPDKAYLFLNADTHYEIKKYGSSKKYGNNISFCVNFNTLSLNEINSLYNICDVFVSASLGEASNLYLKQAMSCGLPCFVIDNNELIKSSSILIPSVQISDFNLREALSYNLPDLDSLSQSMLEFHENPSKRIKGTISKEIPAWETVAKGLSSHLSQLIKESPLNTEFKNSVSSFKLIKF